MDPVYNWGAPYPYQGDQMQYWPHNFPGSQAGPAQMCLNPAWHPINYESWPWGNNCGYGGPVACHGCGNHNYVPSHYVWRPPYSPVSSVHCHGNCPFPMQYMLPPPFAMQQPQYEYEMNMPRSHHCCGCPNHPSHQKEQKSVRMEEEEPDGERKKNDSVGPFKFKNYPHPIVWLPPDYENNKDQRKLKKSEKDEKDGYQDVKAHEDRRNVEQRPTVWNKWYPGDLEKLVSSNQRGDGERNMQHEDEGKWQFPFPIFWMPYGPGEIDRKANKTSDVVQEPALGSVKASEVEQNSDVNGECAGGSPSSKSKNIPVKEVPQHVERESISSEEKEKGKKSPEDSLGRKSCSPPKSSKLPPVCLRVDPLPRKKTSRSPSPPGNKQKRDQMSAEAGKVPTSSDYVKVTKDESEGKGGAKTIEVVNGKASQGNNMDVNLDVPITISLNSPEDILRKETESKPYKVNISGESFEHDGASGKVQSTSAHVANGESSRNEDGIKDKAKECYKSNLSEEQAATIIQSAYRGYDVRRWESLKKLKQIAKVREQIDDVKNRIQALESSSDVLNDSKQRTIIAETIMSLLLKLDTIQGLHPSIRDVRKSVVKELVGLQEKLDSLIGERSKASFGTDSSVRHDEQACKESVEVSSSESAKEADFDSQESCQRNLTAPEKNLIGEQVTENLEKAGAESSESSVDEVTETASDLSMTIESQSEKMNKDDKFSTFKSMEDHENEDVAQSNFSAEVSESSPIDGDGLGNEVAELLLEMPGDCFSTGGTNNVQFEDDFSGIDNAKHLKEMPEAPESKDEKADEVNKEEFDLQQVLDLSPAENNSPLGNKETSTKKEVDNKVEDATTYEIFETNEAPDKRETRTEEADKENDALCSELHDDSGVLDSSSPSKLEALKKSLEEGIKYDKLAQEEQEMSPVNDSANSFELADMIEEKEIAAEKSEGDAISLLGQNVKDSEEVLGKPEPGPGSPDAPENREVLSEPIEEHNTGHVENPNAQHLKTSTGNEENAAIAGDDLRESNGKLIEENQKLREMMEKFIEAGEEQLAIISALSGRVEDLERKLSKKRNLKKQRKGTKSGLRELHELMAV